MRTVDIESWIFDNSERFAFGIVTRDILPGFWFDVADSVRSDANSAAIFLMSSFNEERQSTP